MAVTECIEADAGASVMTPVAFGAAAAPLRGARDG
jgi:hypothetical protein